MTIYGLWKEPLNVQALLGTVDPVLGLATECNSDVQPTSTVVLHLNPFKPSKSLILQ
jgi:hypothetical protein